MLRIFTLSFIAFFIGFISESQAQLVSNNAFLKGNYLEVGMAPCGVFGSTVYAPSAYHTQGSSYLGFVADVDKDGWNSGSPNFIGDYFRPGTPEEGFAIEINGTNYGNFNICSYNQISGSFTSVVNTGATVSAIWQGSVNGIDVLQVTEFDTNTVFFSTTVTLTNSSSTTKSNIYYMRNVDPDNEQPLTGSYLTNNNIVYQNPNTQNLALVSATGITYGSVVALGAQDSRARVTHGGFSNRSASAVYNASGNLNGSGSSTYVDQAISIAFELGDLSPGESTCMTFFYIFDTDEYSTALSSTSFECINLSVTQTELNLCHEDSFTVTYSLDTANVVPQTGNVFTVQLSDSNGSFSSPTDIGSKATLNSEDSISCYIPSSVPYGTGYRVRVVMDNPEEIGADNGTDITVGMPQPQFGSSSSSCSGTPTVLTVDPGAQFYVWSNGSTSNSITVTSTGNYSVTVLNGNCIDTFSTYVTTYVSPLLFLDDSAYDCNTDSAMLTAGLGYPQYLWSNGSTSNIAYVPASGTYTLTVTGTNGCTASDSTHMVLIDARITASTDSVCPNDDVVLTTQLYSDCIYFLELTTGDLMSEDIESYINDDHGPIAVTPNYVYYTGDLATVRMDADDLSNKVQFLKRDGMFSDLATGNLYTFWNYNYNQFYPQQITALRLMNENLSYLGSIDLTTTIQAYNYGNGVFAGEGYVLLYTYYNNKIYHISLPDGNVTEIATAVGLYNNIYNSESWASYGVAECTENGYAVVFRNQAGNVISRYDISDQSYSVVTNFGQYIGDMSSIAYSPWSGEWFYHIEGSAGIFGNGNENFGKAKATLGSKEYQYQWSTGDSASTIVVNPLTSGTYSVTISYGGFSCTDQHTVHVKGAGFSSLNDTILACDTSINSVDAGAGFTDYEWSTGDSVQVITVPNTYDRYVVSVTDSAGCSAVRKYTYIPATGLLQVDEGAICANDTLLLRSQHMSACNSINLSIDNAQRFEVSSTFSNDASGLVVTSDYVYYNTSSATYRFSKELGSPTSLPQRRGLLVNTLNDQLLMLGDTNIGGFNGGNANVLFKLDASLNILDTMLLSESLNFGLYSGVFMGSGYAIVYCGNPDIFYRIDLFDGSVEQLSSNYLSLPYAEDFAIYGIAECKSDGGHLLYYSPNSTYMYTYDIASTYNTQYTISSASLGFLESIAPSFSDGRWYFHYEGSSATFGNGNQSLGYANMDYVPHDLPFVWSDGDSTAARRIIAQAANGLSLSVSVSGQTCADTAFPDLISIIDLGLPDSIFDCYADATTLTISTDPSIVSYAWSTGDTGTSIVANQFGSYTAYAVDTFGCTHSESTMVGLMKAEIIPSSPSNCDSTGITLSVDAELTCSEANELTFNNSGFTDLYPTLNDDRGGIAVTPNYIYYVGDNGTARVNHNLDSLTLLTLTDQLFYDVSAGSLYKLGSFPSSGINTIYQLNENLAVTDTIYLDSPISSSSYNNVLLASGSGFVIIGVRNFSSQFRFYHVELTTGITTLLNNAVYVGFYYPEYYTISAFAQCSEDGYEIIYRDGSYSNRISRLSFSGSSYTIDPFFYAPSSFNDVDGIAFSPWNQRWYFHSESGTSLGSAYEGLYYADADINIGKTILWSTGQTSHTIAVNPSIETSYWVEVSYFGETCSDSITVGIANASTFSFPDTFYSCSTLVEVDAGTGFTNYLWSTGDTGQIILSGNNPALSVTVTDTNGCNLSGTTMALASNFTISAPGDGLCAGDSMELTVIEGVDACLGTLNIGTSGSSIHTITSTFDDYSGIAISRNYLFATSDYNTVRFDKNNFDETVFTQVNGIFSDLKTFRLYSLWNSSVNGFNNTINSLREYDESMNVVNEIPLSQNIQFANYYNGVFAGAGFVVLYSSYGDSAFYVDISNGEVSFLGNFSLDSYMWSSEGFASYGVATCDASGGYLLHFKYSYNYIRALNTSSGVYSTTFYSSSTIGDLSNFTYSWLDNRWYFQFEGYSSMFGSGSSESVGYATASADLEYDGDLLWSTGDTSLFITVSPTSTTTFSANYDNGTGNICSDSFTLLVSSPPTFSLDSFYSGCADSSMVISLPAYNHYLWSTGDTTQSFVPTNSGILWVQVADTLGCWTRDTALVQQIEAHILSESNHYCGGDSAQLLAKAANQTFRVVSFLSSGSEAISVGNITLDDNAGIAVTPRYAYLTGDAYTVRAIAEDLSDQVSMTHTPSLFAEYGEGRLYKFWNTSSGSFASALNAVVELDEDLNPIDTVMLSQSISINLSGGTDNAVFPGAGYVILYVNTGTSYHIDLETGTVTVLSTTSINSSLYNSEGWASYGFAEFYQGQYSMVYRSGNYLVRFNLSSVSNISYNSYLGDIANIAYSPWNKRWYMGWEGGAFPGYYSECLGYANIVDYHDFGYLWSTGDTTRIIHVAPTSPTTYTLHAYIGEDTCSTDFTLYPDTSGLAITLNDTIQLCGGAALEVTGSGIGSLLWNTGETSAQINPSGTGLYSVTATSTTGCEAEATSLVKVSNGSISTVNPSNTCIGDSVLYAYTPDQVNCLAIDAFTSVNGDALYVGSYTGDDNAGFAVTEDYIYVNGDNYVVKVNADLSTIAAYYSYSHRYPIFSDLDDGTLYALWSSGSSSLNTNNINTIYVLNENMAVQSSISLSQTIAAGSGSAIYAGKGFVIVYSYNDNNFYKINLANGFVTNIGTSGSAFNPYSTEGIFSYGIADCSEFGDILYFRGSTSGSIIRAYEIQTGVGSNFQSFSNLGDAAMIGYSPWNERWYGASEYSTQFINSSEHVFSADIGLSSTYSGSLLWSNGSTNDSTWFTLDSTENYISVSLEPICTTCGACVYHDTIVADSALNITATTLSNNNCPEALNGSVMVSVAGSSLYSTLWNTGDTLDTLNTLSKGVYHVSVSTASGCTSTDSAVVTAPDGIQIFKQINPPTCPGDTNGSIEIIVTGPFQEYAYLWSTGSTWHGDSNLNSGTYSVTITDSNGCEYYRSYFIPNAVPVASPSPITVSQNPVCSGNPVTVSAFSGIIGGSNTSIFAMNSPVQFTYQDSDSLVFTFVGLPTVFSSTAILQTYYRGDLDNQDERVYYYGEDGYFLGTSDPTAGCANYYGTKSFNISASLLNTWNADDTVRIIAVTSQAVNQCSPKFQGYVRFNYIQGTKTYWFTSACQSSVTAAFDSNSSFTTTPDSTITYYAQNFSSGCWSQCDSVSVNVQPGAHITTNFDTINLCDLNSINLKAEGAEVFYWQPSTGLNTVVGDSVIAGPTIDRTYTIYGQNSNGCMDTAYVRVNVDESLSVGSQSIVDPLCVGDSNASIDVTIAGGNPPLSYLWNTGDTTTTISMLPQGNYWLYANDTIGQCHDTFSFDVTDPDTLDIAFTISDVSCFGASDGSINAQGLGGNLPYSYLWNTGDTSSLISNLSIGTYFLTLTDANGCTTIHSASITQPAVLNVSLSIDTIHCVGASTGAIYTSINGGSSPFLYLWSEGSTTAALTGIDSGMYSVVVTDNQGCTDTAGITLSDGDPISTSLAIESGIDCLGDTSGMVVATSTTPGASFVWSDGSVNDTLFNAGAGVYYVSTTNTYGCSRTDSVELANASQNFTINIDSLQNISCFGSADGYVDISVAGLTGPYTYLWSNGNTSNLDNDLNPGNHIVSVTDSAGCADTIHFSISEPVALSIALDSLADVDCYGDSTGLIMTTVSGGTAPLVINWSSGGFGDDIFALPANDYILNLDDQNGCSISDTFTVVNKFAILESTFVLTDINCQGDSTGEISTVISGGDLPYTYAWSNGATVANLSELPEGNYLLTLTDNAGCSITDSGALVHLSNPDVAINVQQVVTCHDGNNAVLNAVSNNGVVPYTYAWSNGADSSFIDSLEAGNYVVTITDSLGCTASDTVDLLNPALLTLGFDSLHDALCFGDSNGLVSIHASGGEGSLTYSWNNGATSPLNTGLPAGAYTLTVSDSLSCTKDTSINISEPFLLELTITDSLAPLCTGSNDGIINASVTGGSQPYTLYWNGSPGTLTDSSLLAGTYGLLVVDDQGCNATDTVTLVDPLPISIVLDSIAHLNCYNDASGIIAIHATGGSGELNYLWNNASTDSVLSGLDTGTYSVLITDTNACTLADTFELLQPDSLYAQIVLNQNTSCYLSTESGVLEVMAYGGVGNYQYAWSNGDDLALTDSLPQGVHTVTITDSNACFVVVADTVLADTFPIVSLSDFGDFCVNTDSIELGGGLPAGGSYFGNQTVNGYFLAQSAGSGVHPVYYTFSDMNGCADTASAMITIDSMPVVSFDPLPIACVNVGAFVLDQGSPAGGSYFGTGITGDTFDPAISDTGSFTLGYTIMTPGGCTDTAWQDLVVSIYPELSYVDTAAICGNNLPVLLRDGNPTGGYHLGTGVVNGIFNPADVTGSSAQIAYVFEHICGIDTAFHTIQLHPFPLLDLEESASLCINESTTFSTEESYSTYLWNNTLTTPTYTLHGKDIAGNSKMVSLRVSNTFGCTARDEMQVNALDTQSIAIADTTVCLEEVLWLYAPEGSGLIHTWNNGIGGATFEAYRGDLIREDSASHSLVVENALGCLSRDSIRVRMIDCDTIRTPGFYNIYPNPARENFTIEAFLQFDQEVNVHMYDAAGRLLDIRKFNLPRGKNFMDIKVSNYGAGVMILRFTVDGVLIAERIVLL